MTGKIKTQDVVQLTGTTRRRLELWVRTEGLIDIPKVRPLVWDEDQVLAAALITDATDAGAPLDALRGIHELIRNAGSRCRLRAAQLVVTLPTRKQAETGSPALAPPRLEWPPYGEYGSRLPPDALNAYRAAHGGVAPGALLPSGATLETYIARPAGIVSGCVCMFSVEIGLFIDWLDARRTELLTEGALDEREAVEVA
jgi:hypothetical protein